MMKEDNALEEVKLDTMARDILALDRILRRLQKRREYSPDAVDGDIDRAQQLVQDLADCCVAISGTREEKE